MLRQFHSLPGLIAALLVMLLAISGAILAVDPALERLHSTSTPAGQLNVGQLAGRVASHFPGVEQIQRTASGTVIVYYNQNGQAGAQKVDPLTGQGLAPYEPSAFSRWVKDLHRSMFLGTPGHGVSGVGALFMLMLSENTRGRVGVAPALLSVLRRPFGLPALTDTQSTRPSSFQETEK